MSIHHGHLNTSLYNNNIKYYHYDKILNISSGRVKTSTVVELSLYSKLSGVLALEFGRDATVGGDPNDTLRVEGDLHCEVFSDTPTPSQDAGDQINLPTIL